jgi:RND family efflux transporter, MFP subunit
MRKKFYWAILLAITLAGLGYYWGTAAAEVEVGNVSRGNIYHTVTDTGYVQAAQKIDVYATQGGRIINMPVKVGQNIKKGQVIMVLQNRDLAMSSSQMQIQLSQAEVAAAAAEAAISQGQLDVEDAQNEFNRDQELYNAGAISQVEYDAARSRLNKNQASLDAGQQAFQSANEQVSNYKNLLDSSTQKESELQITSPIDGTLMQLPVEQEQAVSYGTLLAQVAQAGDLEIKVDLLSDDLGEVQVGQQAQITAPVLADKVLNGEVIQIYPQAEEKESALGVVQRRVPTIIRLGEYGNLKPGYETRVSIITASDSDVLLIPREAVMTAASGEKQVMAVVNGRIALRTITTGLTDSKNIEITGGLNEGDQIVKDASVVLQANTRVKAKQV